MTYQEIADDLALLYRQAMQKPVQRRGSRGSYTTIPIASGNTFKKTVGKAYRESETRTRLFVVSSEYWRFANYGRKTGGLPPVYAIERWIKAKGLRLNPWAVAKSIEKRGTNKPPALWAEQVSIEPALRKIAEKSGSEFSANLLLRLRKL